MENDTKRLQFLVHVLTAACDKGYIPAAPWSVWLKQPDREAMRAYRTKLTPLLTGPEEGISMAMADIAWRTVRLLQGASGLTDAAGVVGMLVRFLYDQFPGAADQIEKACLDAICSKSSCPSDATPEGSGYTLE